MLMASSTISRLEGAGKIFGLAVAVRMIVVGGLQPVSMVSAIRRRARLTRDSSASDSKPTDGHAPCRP